MKNEVGEVIQVDIVCRRQLNTYCRRIQMTHSYDQYLLFKNINDFIKINEFNSIIPT